MLVRVTAAVNKPKIIEEFSKRVNSCDMSPPLF
jgi:hypothetical protein